MSKSTEELIREALEKATPGQWTYDPFINGYGVKAGGYSNQVALITENSGIDRSREQAKNNAHLIANAPTWLKYLLDKVELEKDKSAKWEKAFDNTDRQYLKIEREAAQLRKENAAMREALEQIRNQPTQQRNYSVALERCIEIAKSTLERLEEDAQ